MADEIASPKIVITVTAEQAKAALRDLKTVGSDAAKGLESALGTALDSTSKRLKRLSDDLSGKTATRGLQELEKVFHDLGGAASISGEQLERFRAKHAALVAQGGKAPLGGLTDALKSVGPGAQAATAATDQLQASMQGLASKAGPVGSIIAALGPAGLAAAAGIGLLTFGVGALGHALIESVDQARTYADRFDDLSAATEMGTDALQTFAFSAKLGSGSVEQITTALFKMEKALFKTPQVFEDLGFSIEKFKALKPEDQLIALGDALEAIPDKIERDNAALELTGKKWGDLKVILEGVRNGASDTLDTIGAKMDSNMIKKMAELDSKIKTLDEAWQGLWRNIGASVAQSVPVKTAIDEITKSLGQLSNMVKNGGIGGVAANLASDIGEAGLGAGLTLVGRGDLAAGLFADMTSRNAQQAKISAGQALLTNGAPAPSASNGSGATPKFDPQATERAKAAAKQQAAIKKLIDDSNRRALERARKQLAERDQHIDPSMLGFDVEGGLAPGLLFTGSDPGGQMNVPTLPTSKFAGSMNKLGSGKITGENERKTAVGQQENMLKLQTQLNAKTTDWARELQNVVNAAGFMPKIFGDVLGSVASIGTAMKGFDFSKAGGGFSLTGGEGLGGLLGNVMPAMQIAGVGINLVKNIASALHQSESEKIMKDVGRDFGVNISEGLAKQIEKDVKAGKGRYDATLKNLGAVISEGGGVEKFVGKNGQSGVDNTIAKMHDLFSAMEGGALSAKEVGGVFDDVFGQVLPLAIDKTTGRLQDNARELIRLAQSRGVQSKEVAGFVQGQSAVALDGLRAFMDSAKITTQASATVIGGAIAKIYDDLISTGLSKADALKAIAPAVNELRAQLADTGFTGSTAFAALDAQISLLNDEKFGPVIAGVTGIGDAMMAMHNINLLTQEDFTVLSSQVTETFNKMVADGADGNAALAAISPTLQQIFELQQDYGLAVDESTQKLLDQAVAAGMVGDAHRSAEDRMSSSMDRLVGIFELVAEKLGVTRDALDSLKDKNINVNVNIKTNGQMPGGGDGAGAGGFGDTGDEGGPASNGDSGEPQYASGSGGLLNFGAGTRAILHGEEAVLTRRQLNNVMRGAMLAGAGGGGSSGGGSGAPASVAAPDPVLLAILAELSAQTTQGAHLPRVLGKVTRDAVADGKVAGAGASR